MEEEKIRYRRHIALVLAGCAVLLFIFLITAQAKSALEVRGRGADNTTPAAVSGTAVTEAAVGKPATPEAVTAMAISRELTAESMRTIKEKVPKAAKPSVTPKPTPVPTPAATKDETDRIASFYQGDLSYQSGLTWSGNWGKKKFKKKTFGSFGCGLCCLANVYSSLTDYRCSPLDMYEYACENTGYRGGGAIEWWNMGDVLTKTGFTYTRGKKPKEYKDFQKTVRKSKAVIVLVSQGKKSYWENTTGHYVTLFLYDKKTDKVFLADSGSYKRNRHWVPLKKVYDSLKKTSDSQYLSVLSYKKKNDTWRNTEFTGKCILPSNWETGKK